MADDVPDLPFRVEHVCRVRAKAQTHHKVSNPTLRGEGGCCVNLLGVRGGGVRLGGGEEGGGGPQREKPRGDEQGRLEREAGDHRHCDQLAQ